MWKKMCRGMEKWGHYLLALLCAGVIVLSAAWTREQQGTEQANQTALSDQSQRLSTAAKPTEAPTLTRPAAGAVLRGYSAGPVFFPQTGVWKAHPALDFEAEDGAPVYALSEGTVLSRDGDVCVDHGEMGVARYRGLKEILVQPGQLVRAGAMLGRAGGRIPYEGEGHVCVSLTREGAAIPFGQEWQADTSFTPSP